MSLVEARITELGYKLPATPKPVAAYIPAIRSGNLVFTSGQLPVFNGELVRQGVVGDGTVSIEDAKSDARLACLNGLAAIKSVVGDLDHIEKVVRVAVFVQSTPDFYDQSKIANGASELLLELLGEAGRHVRTSLGMVALPLNATVEVELTVQVREEQPYSV
ncbi:MAG: RidA family protein [Sumerlaeia bacterium]